MCRQTCHAVLYAQHASDEAKKPKVACLESLPAVSHIFYKPFRPSFDGFLLFHDFTKHY